MKAMLLTDPERPKAKREDLLKILQGAGVQVATSDTDIGVVVGGDGIFSHYGRLISVPLLFVSVRSRATTASKGFLAEVDLDELPRALGEIAAGEYHEVRHRRLKVSVNGAERGDVFTDVYLEKGADSNCLRYTLDVRGPSVSFTESAIANGVIVCASAGSTGYYSYVDKLKSGSSFRADRFTQIDPDQIGVCHIAPVYTRREGTDQTPLRYSLPWGTRVKITLTRDADARLFGLTKSRKGLRTRVGDYVEITPSRAETRVLRLGRAG